MKQIIKTLVKKALEKAGYEIALHKITNNNDTSQRIAFIHIPKCGGVSVDTALREKLAHSGERKITRQPLIASSLLSFNKALITLEDMCDFSEHHNQELQRILAYHLNLNWHYVSGHLPVNSQILTHFNQQYSFITVLRDPVERFVSNYIFNKLTNTLPIMPPNCLSTDNLVAEAQQIITSRRGWQMANTTTQFLTGRCPKDLHEAKAMQTEVADNLKKFKVVGFLDNLARFEQECAVLTGQQISIKQRNKTNEFNTAAQQNVQDTLREFFTAPATIKQLTTLCEAELSNHHNAKALKG